MIDAGFEAVLATVLLMGLVYAAIDEDDFPGPGSDLVIALFALALYGLALILATLVKNDAVTDGALSILAAINAGFAALLVLWMLVADGFTGTGRAVIWTTAVILLVLAACQAAARVSGAEPSGSGPEPSSS
jgi:hypothetical protein